MSSDIEKQALLKLIKEVKIIKETLSVITENIDYLVEATNLLVSIETEKVKRGK